jgi:hypothetical protein
MRQLITLVVSFLLVSTAWSQEPQAGVFSSLMTLTETTTAR